MDINELQAGAYHIEIIGTGEGPFNLMISGINDNKVVTSKNYTGNIIPDEGLATNVIACVMEGIPTLLYEPLTAMPMIGIEPTSLEVLGKPNTVAKATFLIKERAGKETVQGVGIYCTDLVGPTGSIDGHNVLFDPNSFDIPPHGQQVVEVTIPIPTNFKGSATGSIVIETMNAGTKSSDPPDK